MVSHPTFFFSPITGSDLEFTTPDSCLMDTRVHTAWLWHPQSAARASSCTALIHPPCLKDRRRSSSVCSRCGCCVCWHCDCVALEPLCPVMRSWGRVRALCEQPQSLGIGLYGRRSPFVIKSPMCFAQCLIPALCDRMKINQ